jgi:hypothetical protein
MIDRDTFLSVYMRHLAATLPASVNLVQYGLLEEMLRSACHGTLVDLSQRETSRPETKLNLKELLRDSAYVVAGNSSGRETGILYKHLPEKFVVDALNCRDWGIATLRYELAEQLPKPILQTLNCKVDIPAIVHGRTMVGGYIRLSYGVFFTSDPQRNGNGNGFALETTVRNYETILAAIRADPKGVFQLFKTMHDDHRIMPPKMKNYLAIIPLVSAKKNSLEGAEYLPLDYAPSEQHLHTW